MKRAIHTILFSFFFFVTGFTQSSIKDKLIIPGKFTVLLFEKKEKHTPGIPTKKLIILPESIQQPGSVISNLLFIMLKETTKRKATLFITEVSFNDILESYINGVNGSLINTYDDHISELFKDAPSIVKLKCIIKL
ncbi:MAG: hypothetical protein ABI666_11900 [Ferruginibacter sp.]